MNPIKSATASLLLAAALSLVQPAIAADVEAGLLAVTALGSLNGQALACTELKIAGRAKSLMLAHAPKTQRFGDAYEAATQAAFVEQTRSGGTCPDTTQLTQAVNLLALRLSETLPVVAAPTTSVAPATTNTAPR